MRFLVAFSLFLLSGATASEKRMLDCVEEADFKCVKTRALSDIYRLTKTKSLDIMEGVTLEYTGDEKKQVSAARAIADHDWSAILTNVVPSLIEGSSLKINIFPQGYLRVSRSTNEDEFIQMAIVTESEVEERGHKKRIFLPAILFGGLYTTLLTLGVIAVKFLVFKALLVGKVSIVLAVITGLARVFDKNRLNQGYGNIEGYGGYKRSYDDNTVHDAILDKTKQYS